jgi:hypothetical protein
MALAGRRRLRPNADAVDASGEGNQAFKTLPNAGAAWRAWGASDERRTTA